MHELVYLLTFPDWLHEFTPICDVTQTLQEDSLAWFLAESGYHVWLLDLRGER